MSHSERSEAESRNLLKDEQKRPSGQYVPKSVFSLDPERFPEDDPAGPFGSRLPPVVGHPE